MEGKNCKILKFLIDFRNFCGPDLQSGTSSQSVLQAECVFGALETLLSVYDKLGDPEPRFITIYEKS